MRMKYARELLAAILAFALACGGRASSTNGSGTDAGIQDASISDAPAECGRSTGRVPLNHRPAGSACPQERAAVSPEASTCTAPKSSLCGTCTKDSDCTAGRNGRCGNIGPVAYLGCSYDECLGDSNCEGGAPCQCRASSLSGAANTCVTGSNCQVDSDCGPGSYCSPSVLSLCFCMSTALCGDSGGGCYAASGATTGPPPGPGWTSIPCSCGDGCGHGFFCHTCSDTCVDDSDCDGGGTCNYDTLNHRWDCSLCWPVP
jgi:hypothetical protein